MIKIKIEAASGADLRAQLIALLGETQNPVKTITGDQLIQNVVKRAEIEEARNMDIVKTEEKPVEEKQKKLTKKEQAALDAAEAEANQAATLQSDTTEDTPSDQVETLAQDNTDQNAEPKITLDVLREMVLRLSRNGLKDATKKIIGTFSVERITELKEEQYPAFYAAIKPNYDTLTEDQA